MQIVSYLFDFLFPPRPQETLLREAKKLSLQPGMHCGTEYLSQFKSSKVKAAITENKYHNNYDAVRLLANLVDEWLISNTEEVVLIPIPLSKERLKTRGYNQVFEVLKKLKSEAAVLEDVLFRVKNTESQTSLNKQQRQANLKNAFVVKKPHILSQLNDTTFVIVDDVVTTAATMDAARAEVSLHLSPSCKLKTLAFAH